MQCVCTVIVCHTSETLTAPKFYIDIMEVAAHPNVVKHALTMTQLYHESDLLNNARMFNVC